MEVGPVLENRLHNLIYLFLYPAVLGGVLFIVLGEDSCRKFPPWHWLIISYFAIQYIENYNTPSRWWSNTPLKIKQSILVGISEAALLLLSIFLLFPCALSGNVVPPNLFYALLALSFITPALARVWFDWASLKAEWSRNHYDGQYSGHTTTENRNKLYTLLSILSAVSAIVVSFGPSLDKGLYFSFWICLFIFVIYAFSFYKPLLGRRPSQDPKIAAKYYYARLAFQNNRRDPKRLIVTALLAALTAILVIFSVRNGALPECIKDDAKPVSAYLGAIYFGSESSQLQSGDIHFLRTIGLAHEGCANFRYYVMSHADRGGDEYEKGKCNILLSRNRAGAVIQGLVDAGIPRKCIAAPCYFGANHPLYQEHSPETSPLERRAHIFRLPAGTAASKLGCGTIKQGNTKKNGLSCPFPRGLKPQ